MCLAAAPSRRSPKEGFIAKTAASSISGTWVRLSLRSGPAGAFACGALGNKSFRGVSGANLNWNRWMGCGTTPPGSIKGAGASIGEGDYSALGWILLVPIIVVTVLTVDLITLPITIPLDRPLFFTHLIIDNKPEKEPRLDVEPSRF